VAEGGDRDDRTEAPSQRRLERARAEGHVAVSRELPTLAVLSLAALMLWLAAPAAARGLARSLAQVLATADRLTPAAAIRVAGGAAAALLLPLVGAVLVVGSLAMLGQTGFLLSLDRLRPDFERLDPRAGLRRVFGASALFEALKSCAKVGIVGWAAWSAVAGALPALAHAVTWDIATLAEVTAHQVLRVMLAMLAVQAVITVLDVVRVRLRHTRDLRMSRQELKEEHREAEGDPLVKGRLRRIRMARARRRMLAAVPKATMVITNPSHYAVALAYDGATAAAPRLVAKGVDTMAARIRQMAEQHGVPIVANPPLARALYPLELDRLIPPEHYRAVAEIIAYVWRLRRRARPAAGPVR
jgi:flagellar biosynthetic protein FlhB